MFRTLLRTSGVALGAAGFSATQVTLADAGPLSPDEWRAFKLQAIEPISANTSKFRFALPAQSAMPVASCLLTMAPIGKVKEDGSLTNVIRPYTPVLSPAGTLDLVVKVYPEGKMSAHFGKLAVGDELKMKGPIVKLPIAGDSYDSVGMVAGGTGITPMLQILDAILADPASKTKFSLLFGNVSEADILLRERLDKLAAAHPERLRITYIVDKPGWFWSGESGYITKSLLEKTMPAPGPDRKVLVCGPPPMMKAISGAKVSPKDQGEVSGFLADLGYTPQHVFKF